MSPFDRSPLIGFRLITDLGDEETLAAAGAQLGISFAGQERRLPRARDPLGSGPARSIDYLETRADIDSEKLSYMARGWGSRMGPIMLALEPRLKTALPEVAGFGLKPTQPVVDPFNFASRVGVPVLVMSGEVDPVFPLEVSARPFHEALGDIEKEHYIGAGSHFVPWNDLARLTLSWLDRQLGPAQ